MLAMPATTTYVLSMIGCVLSGVLLGIGLMGLLGSIRPKRQAVDTLNIGRPVYDQRNPINMRVPREDRRGSENA